MTAEERNSSLKESGIIFLSGTIDEVKAENTCKDIIVMNQNEKLTKINLFINSCGGDVCDTFSIIDLIEWSKLPIYTIALGQVSSGGLMIFMSGNNRLISPNTSILSHTHSWRIGGKHSEILANNHENELVYNRMIKHYIKYSAVKTEKRLKETLLKQVDTYLTPEEAIKYGLADHIDGSTK